MFTMEIGFARFVAFYTFNFLGVLSFASLRRNEREAFINVMAYGVVGVGIGLAIYIGVVNGVQKFSTSASGRQIAFFNNQNQLAYYCSLVATMVAIFSRFKMMPKLAMHLAPLFF